MAAVREVMERWTKQIKVIEEVLHPSRIEQAPLMDRTTVAEARLIIAALEKVKEG